MMNIDPNKFANQRKSSLRTKNLLPEGMSIEEYLASKNKKLQWDTQVEEIEIVEDPNAKTNEQRQV
jgi:hypothetical protein